MPNLFNKKLILTLHEVEPDPASAGSFRLKQPPESRGYTLSPYTLADIEAVEQWIRQRTLDTFIATVKEIPADILSKEDFLQLIATETKKVSGMGWGSPDGLRLLASVEGLLFLVWQVIHKGTDLTQDTLREMLMVKENQAQVLEAIRRLDCLDSYGVSHPTEARPQGRKIPAETMTMEELGQKFLSNTSSITTPDIQSAKS